MPTDPQAPTLEEAIARAERLAAIMDPSDTGLSAVLRVLVDLARDGERWRDAHVPPDYLDACDCGPRQSLSVTCTRCGLAVTPSEETMSDDLVGSIAKAMWDASEATGAAEAQPSKNLGEFHERLKALETRLDALADHPVTATPVVDHEEPVGDPNPSKSSKSSPPVDHGYWRERIRRREMMAGPFTSTTVDVPFATLRQLLDAIERAAREINAAVAEHGRLATCGGLVAAIIRREMGVGER